MTDVFADTSYWVAIAVPKDQFHSAAKSAKRALGNVTVVTTEEVLTEFLNMMSRHASVLRSRAIRSVRAILDDPNTTVVPQTTDGFRRGLDRYERRPDKQYSLTDCISMIAMEECGISSVLTSDDHFAQEGFTVLIRGA